MAVLRKPFSLLSVAVLLSWLALLAAALLYAHPGLGGVTLSPPAGLVLVLQALFTAVVFLYERKEPERLQGVNFIGLLQRLLLGPALLAVVSVGVHQLLQVLWPGSMAGSVLHTAFYTFNVGLFVLLLARTNYAWRALVLFRGTERLRRQWVAFEMMLGATLLLRLLPYAPPVGLSAAVLGVLAAFGAYLSGRQKWVAYLSRRQKLEAVLLQLAVIGVMGVFVAYFLYTRPAFRLVGPAPQNAFLLLNAFFAGFYALMGLLVTLFNLPTAGVFEQKREEILSMQRLTQLIQRGQTTDEVYQMFFDSAIQTTRADAAWLHIEGTAEEDHFDLYHQLPGEQAYAIRGLLSEFNLSNLEYFNNDLTGSSFRRLKLPFGSLMVMPLSSSKRQYGNIYLLQEPVQAFDRESLSILQTFASQTVLSIENLQLIQASLRTQRVQDELKIASAVQDSLIPKDLPIDNWFEISSYAVAATEVGGDFYDFLHLPGRRLAVLIGDVSGKGVTAAFHVAQMKGIFHALMQENPLARNEREKYPVPSQFMTQANDALGRCLEKSAFITASLYIIDYEHGGFVFARAGHCHTLYYHSIKEEVSYFQTPGLGLGIIRHEGYEKHIKNQFYDYNPGDVMVIYTDGIVEARDAAQNEYGEERLQLMLEQSYYLNADQIKAHILADLHEFTKGQPMHDDQTLLVIKFRSTQPEAGL
ncbi:PP2C family protein-serine/threonine phosphatase [Hymenobacter actinosclerus]|uniref:Serine phosphatase RsbU, regulator of sigma subunit n=1 Tax=Hymenobacter actinosclerus TaxID=82805 RepID=A0A1I0H737_9BACT|nr:GAF domain-containing SpoIIE family protein phosphatase [Hymenobacter actinosclerus]SET79521.1 Serine phosphatase RsbU, regulator of sigma subunit [Hymenobacter actinosclerus]